MRAYFFTNMYLSSLQQGLQSAHCIVNMYERFGSSMMHDWATNHQTIIILNGGYSSNLTKIQSLVNSIEHPYPYASFCESEEALNGALTVVGILLPEKIYEGAAFYRKDELAANRIKYYNELSLFKDDSRNHLDYEINWDYSKFDITLIKEMNKYGLAK